ncbi:uncharacterized protein LOC116254694 [Nymphaea colorata]|uniref:uncharacterized protein LOC116254694 n=1 Tax=Nymphaea colorata TaxID=210225 RepID=UPI00129DF498|nr:uncharacterized protein LOC116254694 [Nymphaea colorata]
MFPSFLSSFFFFLFLSLSLSLSLLMLSLFPDSREMLRLLLLLSLSSLLLLQGSNALCVPRDSHLKARKPTPSRSQSSGGSSPANAPAKPTPSQSPSSGSAPVNAPAKPPPSQSQSSGSSPVNSPAKPPPSPVNAPAKSPPSTPSPVNAPAKPPPSPVNAPTKPSPSPPSPVEEPTQLPSESVPSPVNAPTKPTGSKSSGGSVPSHAPATNSGSGASGVDASIAGFCKQTSYPDVCTSSVKPYLPASGHLSPADMLLMQIKATATKVASATAHANQLLAGTTITPYLRSCLETCKDMYDDMNANFDDAKKALAASDLDTLKTMLSATISDASTCEDGFVEMPGLPMLMGSYDSELSKLTSNCLALADLV